MTVYRYRANFDWRRDVSEGSAFRAYFNEVLREEA